MTDSEHFDQAIDQVSQDRSPKAEASSLTEDERRMLQMAQLLRGSSVETGPIEEFSTRLEERLRRSGSKGVSRRTAVVSGLGALAAGVAAGFGLDRGFAGSTQPDGYPKPPPLVGSSGRWTHVATLADLPEGAVKSFTAGAVAGFLIHRHGQIKAVSGVCTHMGCLLSYEGAKDGLVCPCHGAEFELGGRLRRYPGHDRTWLPPLPRLDVRLEGDSVQVWTA